MCLTGTARIRCMEQSKAYGRCASFLVFRFHHASTLLYFFCSFLFFQEVRCWIDHRSIEKYINIYGRKRVRTCRLRSRTYNSFFYASNLDTAVESVHV
jgi:hypothetical protein